SGGGPASTAAAQGGGRILEVAASYLRNDMAAGRTQEESRSGPWCSGSPRERSWSGSRRTRALGAPAREAAGDAPAGVQRRGQRRGARRLLRPGLAGSVRTPPRASGQKHHRDINFPGPAAQVTMQVALTPLVANNGPLAYVPGSHRMLTPGFEVIANPPLGSVVAYDSFVEHRGIENHGPRDRYAAYLEFETRGVFSGYTPWHFGPRSMEHTVAFRRCDPSLRRLVAAAGARGAAA
ncbi:unnamed protein product, partial [Prorocentrum cordatum]